jgi:hypothetical protein
MRKVFWLLAACCFFLYPALSCAQAVRVNSGDSGRQPRDEAEARVFARQVAVRKVLEGWLRDANLFGDPRSAASLAAKAKMQALREDFMRDYHKYSGEKVKKLGKEKDGHIIAEVNVDEVAIAGKVRALLHGLRQGLAEEAVAFYFRVRGLAEDAFDPVNRITMRYEQTMRNNLGFKLEKDDAIVQFIDELPAGLSAAEYFPAVGRQVQSRSQATVAVIGDVEIEKGYASAASVTAKAKVEIRIMEVRGSQGIREINRFTTNAQQVTAKELYGPTGAYQMLIEKIGSFTAKDIAADIFGYWLYRYGA